MDEKKLHQLRETFPKLWAEYPEQFHLFFTNSGMMNAAGHCVYTQIKKIRHSRMIRHKSKKSPA